MQRISVLAGLTALLLTAPLIKASASPPPIEVTPEYVKTLPYTFVFTNEDRNGLIAVGVTVTPRKGRLSPGLLARLHLIEEKAELAAIPLEETREEGKVTYWFHISPALIAQSRFDFYILSGKEEHLPNGQTRFIAIPGTLEYQFPIRDYVAIKKAAKPAKAGAGHKFSVAKRF